MDSMRRWLTKKVVAWSLYDFADTAFSALFITFFFPILIKTYLGGNELQVGLTFGLSLLVGALIVPFIGAVADATGKKIPLLFASTLVTVLLTATTGYVGLLLALVLGFAANLFNIIDVDLYDSQLVDIAREEDRGKVSGMGVGVGYLGTIASLAGAYGVMSMLGWESQAGIRAMFLTAAAFHFVFSLPLFLTLKDVPHARMSWWQALRRAKAELQFTLTQRKKLPGLWAFLAASFTYNNAMNTVILFLSLYATVVIGFTIKQFFFVFAALAVGSFVGALAAGLYSDRIGPKRMLTVVLLAWIAVVGWFYVSPPLLPAFLVGGIVGGACLGAVWVGNRHMVTRLAPRHKIAEIFGIEGLTEKFSGLVGPVVFGLLVWLAGEGNERAGYSRGLLFVIGLLVVGLLLLRRVQMRSATVGMPKNKS